MKNYGKLTPPGTPPMPTRRSTKHKTVAYGEYLQQRATERRARRAAVKGRKGQAA